MHSRRLLILLAALALVAAGCGGGGEGVEIDGAEEGTEPPEAGGGEAGGGGQPAEGGTLIAAISGEPDQLDPHKTTAYPSFQVLENVYDTLVQPNEELEFEPALATEWETSDDGLTWTFQLREGVKWHNGDDFTAEDVVFSYNRIIDEELANAFRFSSVEEVRAVDDLTVEIALSRPTPNLLSNIGAFKGMAIIHRGTAGDIGQEPMGTGPFAFENYREGSSLTLSANPDYWGEGPNVEGVEVRFIPEGTTALTALRTGEVDWTDNIPPQNVAEILESGELESDAVPSNDYWYYALNFAREPFGDPQVREALAYGFDRQAVTEAAKFDAATVNQTAIPETSSWYYDYAPYEHDPDQARQLLEEAGAENLEVDLMVTNEFEETIQAAQVLESQWGEIGVDVNIRSEEFATWLDEQGKGNFDAFLLGWLGNIDPDDFYYSQHHSEGSNNYHKYSNQEVNQLLDQARRETDQDARKELYDQAVKMIVDDNSYTYLYNPDVVQAWQPVVEGYTVRPDRAIRFENVTLNR